MGPDTGTTGEQGGAEKSVSFLFTVTGYHRIPWGGGEGRGRREEEERGGYRISERGGVTVKY